MQNSENKKQRAGQSSGFFKYFQLPLIVAKISIYIELLTLKRLGGYQFDPLCGFSKNLSFKERVKHWNFMTFIIIISYIFPENFIEIVLVVQKIHVILSFFGFFLAFPCNKETNGLSLYLMMSVFFHFKNTSNRLYKVIQILANFFLAIKLNPQRKLPSKSPALLGLKLNSVFKSILISSEFCNFVFYKKQQF